MTNLPVPDVVDGLIVSGAEPERLRYLGTSVSNEPEEYGADFLWTGYGDKLWGLQRKTISDFISSLHDGRLGMELQQMQQLDMRMMLLEGQPKWTVDNKLVASFGPEFTKDQFHSLKLSITMMFGVSVFDSQSITDTMELVRSFVEWSRKEEHVALMRRPKEKSQWGSASSQDYRCWLLQSVPGVGPKLARVIDEALGGQSPYSLRVTREDLLAIEGVGPKTADAIIAAVVPPTKSATRRKKRRSK